MGSSRGSGSEAYFAGLRDDPYDPYARAKADRWNRENMEATRLAIMANRFTGLVSGMQNRLGIEIDESLVGESELLRK